MHTTRSLLRATFAVAALTIVASCGAQATESRSETSTVGADATGHTETAATEPTLGVDNSAAAVGSGCATPDGFGAEPIPTTYPYRTDKPESDAPVDQTTREPVASSAQAAVDDVVGKLGFGDILSAKIGGPPTKDAYGPWLYVVAVAPVARDGFIVRPSWEAITILGAAAEEASTTPDLADAIEGYALEILSADCNVLQAASVRIGPRASGQIFTATGGSADTDFVRGVLGDYGVRPIAINTNKAIPTVIEIVGSVPAATAMNGNLTRMFLQLKGQPLRFESILFDLTTEDGAALASMGSSTRIASGTVWTEPGLDEVLGIAHQGGG